MIIEFPNLFERGQESRGWKIGPTPFGEAWVMIDGSIAFFAPSKDRPTFILDVADCEAFGRTWMQAVVVQRKRVDQLHGRTVVRVLRVEGDRVIATYRRCEIALGRQGTIKPTACVVCKAPIAKGEQRFVEHPHRGSWRHFQRASWCLACVPAIPAAKGLREVGS